jgi:hypothetical protein
MNNLIILSAFVLGLSACVFDPNKDHKDLSMAEYEEVPITPVAPIPPIVPAPPTTAEAVPHVISR